VIRKSTELHLGQPAGHRGAGEIPIRHVRLVRPASLNASRSRASLPRD
jgi:hypothetical protein